METKILKAVFGGGTSTVTNKRTRTDYGQVLEIIGIDLPDTFECIFSNSATSAGVGKKQIGSAQRVLIPDEYLATGQPIYAWILLHDGEGDGRHMYSIRIPVADMPDTSPEEPTPVEQSVISQAITALNTAVDTTAQKAQEAADSANRAEQAAEGTEGYAERAEAAQQAAESARDIALEAKVSAQASAATTTEGLNEVRYWADIINRAYVKIDDWTQIAYGASQQAIVSEQASTESARQASQSAETASTKAQEASGFASEASQKASEAAQSASTATQAKTDAITAKQASETAQGLAETARNEAVNAKTGAESARDEAQNIADGITGKVEQIDSNTDRIESLEDDRYKPYAVDSASGNIASFSDGADNIPLKSCIVRVEPVQAGSGDPSPENVRPITGWTGCEVQRTGVNLFDIINGETTLIYDGVAIQNNKIVILMIGSGATSRVYFAEKYEPGTYTLSAEFNGDLKEIRLFSPQFFSGGTYNAYYGGYFANIVNGTITATFTESFTLGIIGNGTVRGSGEIYNIQLELGSTPTPYEPYTGQTYPITFPTEAGTVYGGTLDVTGGEFVVDRAQIASYNGETLPSTWISDRDVYASGTTPTIGAQVVYKLAEPIHYPLSPNQIKSLYGHNNLWADTGDTEVEYRADVTLYINKKIAEAISALS